MMIIKDEFMGTPMKKTNSGGYILEEKISNNIEFITINKLIDGAMTAKDENVESYYNFIFEIDNESIELQKKRAKRLFENNIVNRVVYSGGKSIHCRITIVDAPENKEEYKYVWNELNMKYFENKADKACSNPARLTRMPNAIRDNGIKQKRMFLSNIKLLFEWRENYELDKQIEEYSDNKQVYDYNFENGKTSIEVLLNRNIPEEARKLLENNFIDGERHKMIPKAIAFLKVCGFELQELEILVKATKVKDSSDWIKRMYKFYK